MSSETVQLKMITPAPITNGSQPGETIRIGTRKSPLALIQVDQVVEILKAAHPHINFSTHTVSVQGDRDKTSAFLYMKKDVKSASEAMKNLWTIEMEEMLLRNDLDMLVHCLKDMPTTLPEGCTLGSIILREDPRDALVMRKDLPFRGLDELAPGAVVGCCSARRKALVMRSYPHLVTQDCRGNV